MVDTALAAAGVPSARRQTRTVIGRRDELARLQEIYREATSGRTRTVLLGGDAGVGKTTLIDAFAADAGGVMPSVLRGQCVPLGGDGLPYAPIAGVLRALLARYGADTVQSWAGPAAADVASLLPELGERSGPVDAERLRLFEAVVILLERAAAQQPVIVVVEDVHWADDSTRDLIQFVVSALPEAALCLVMTFRTDELTRRHPLRPFLADLVRWPGAMRIDLGPLGPEEVRALVSTVTGGRPTAALAEEIYRRSEGIPYFAEELAAAAVKGCRDLPDTLRDALLVRITVLPTEVQHLLRLMATHGNRVPHDLVAAVSAAEPLVLDGWLRVAIDAALVVPDERGYAFRHALLREVLHDDLLPGEHARLHARFGDVLEQHLDLLPEEIREVELSYHFYAGHVLDKAFAWSIRAARRPGFAYRESLRMYERALELWDAVPDADQVAGPRVALVEAAARTANDAGELDRALALMNAALELTDPATDPQAAAWRLDLKGRLQTGLHTGGAVQTLERAVALVPAQPPSWLRAKVLDSLAIMQMMAGAKAAAIVSADQAIAAAEAVDAPLLASSAHNTRGVALATTGREQEGIDELGRARELAGDNLPTRLRHAVNVSDVLHLTGHYRAAAEEALTGIELARTAGRERSLGAMLAGNAAAPLLALGEWPRARRLLQWGLELRPSAQHWEHLRGLSAWCCVWTDRLDEAQEMVAEFEPLLHGPVYVPEYRALAARVAIDLAVARDNPERAWAVWSAVATTSILATPGLTLPLLSAAAASLADRRAGTELTAATREQRRTSLAEVAADLPPSGTTPHWRPLIDAGLIDTADGWREAVARLDGSGAPAHLLPYANWQLTELLVRDGERTTAREVAVRAIEQATTVGGRLDRASD